MQHRDAQYSNVVSLRPNSDHIHATELVIEEYDHWGDSAVVEAISFCGACGFDGEFENRAAA